MLGEPGSLSKFKNRPTITSKFSNWHIVYGLFNPHANKNVKLHIVISVFGKLLSMQCPHSLEIRLPVFIPMCLQKHLCLCGIWPPLQWLEMLHRCARWIKKQKQKKTKLLFIRNSLSTELPIRPGFQIVVSVWVIGYSILFSE